MFSAYFQSADPTEAKTYVQSSAVLQMSADVLNATCIVTYDSGNTYLYQGVSRRAILRFIYDAERSLGKFTNDVLKANTVKCTEVPSTVMLALAS
jgi:hypothetical protein